MRLLSFAAALSLLAAPLAFAAGEAKHPEHQHWHHSGVFGQFDRAQLQRGYLVYKQVCAACHGMKLLSYRNLSEPGGPELPEGAVKALAAEFQIPDTDDDGNPIERPATPADRFKYPYANEKAGRAANNGAYPPDLSVIVKARHGGDFLTRFTSGNIGAEDYIYALLTGYKDPPADMTMGAGMNYNPYFPNGQIAMPNPLGSDDLVEYADGTKATKEQMARDVTAFLAWAAEPRQEERKRLGVKVMAFTFVLLLVFYAAYRRLWRDVAH
jgi:ubiquinol-cytochrome c reductase cytochrome c1 subunit